MTEIEPKSETPVERLQRLIAAREAVLNGVWRWNGQKANRIATREIVEEELHDIEGAGMATAGPRLVAIVTVLLAFPRWP
jgi:hypothetical protein